VARPDADVNEALTQAPHALVCEIDRVRDQPFDALQQEWVRNYHEEFGALAAISTRKAQTYRKLRHTFENVRRADLPRSGTRRAFKGIASTHPSIRRRSRAGSAVNEVQPPFPGRIEST
jgi:hypothetical protein